MTPEQAYQILNNAIASIQANRQTHQLMAQALEVLMNQTKDKNEQE